MTGHNEQRSVSVGLLRNGQIVQAGNVTVPPNQSIPHLQSIIEVRYLYAHRNSGILYQPTLLAQRTDVSHAECVVAQLKFKGDDEASQ